MGAHYGDLAGMIPRRLSLLVARLVLLVHHHDPEVTHRGEDRGARTDGDPAAEQFEAAYQLVAQAIGAVAIALICPSRQSLTAASMYSAEAFPVIADSSP